MAVEHGTRLHDQLAAMVGVEHSIEVRMGRLLEDPIGQQHVVALVERVREESRDRRLALAARLEAVAPGTPVPEPVTDPSALEVLTASGRHPGSGALLAAHTLLQQAVTGYAVLIELAFRAADSVEHLGPENTGDLVWAHMRACASLAETVARALPYAVVDELEEAGHDCRCQCFTCGLGICGCPLAFRRRLDMAWSEAGPVEEWPGIPMVRPRPGTPAAVAGLAKGDVVLRVDGATIDSIPGLRASIEAHGPGDAIELEVRRADGRTEAVVIRRA